MQSVSWYVRRLRAMSPAEVLWRVQGMARDGADLARFAVGRWPPAPAAAVSGARLAEPTAPRLCDLVVGEWAAAPVGSREAAWRDRLVVAAAGTLSGRLRIFDEEFDVGSPVPWNRDHALGRDTPRGFAPWIDYRDLRVAGDAKIVWDPNRHQHLPVLARAYRATGDVRYARAAVDQWESWLDQCPFPTGMNWRSPLELAIRTINWVWTLDAIRDAGVLTPAFAARLLDSMHLHLWDTARKFSRGSSANNHLIGEAAGVFVGAAYFPDLDPSGRWANRSSDILAREIIRQTTADGATREQAFGYQLFVLQLLLTAGLVGRRTGRELPQPFWDRLEKMLEFVCLLCEGGPFPLIGDADDGYVLDLGRSHDDAAALLSVGALLCGRADFAAAAGDVKEPARWWLGRSAVEGWGALAGAPGAARLTSKAFDASGYYLLQSGTVGQDDGISVLFDCAPLGFTEIAAHGHADALSVVVRAFGRDVLVDPGTFDYFSYPEWRQYFRSTRAHNTIEIDGCDQSVQQGLFLWGARAESALVAWDVGPDTVRVTGRHDGYRRLADPVTHERTARFDGSRGLLTIQDALTMRAAHDVRIFFHCAEGVDVTPAGDGQWLLQAGPHHLTLALDPRFVGRVQRGSEAPIGGWVSRAYHRRRPSCTIVGEALGIERDTTFETRLTWSRVGAV